MGRSCAAAVVLSRVLSDTGMRNESMTNGSPAVLEVLFCWRSTSSNGTGRASG